MTSGSHRRLALGLGVAQLIAWGALYYPIAALAGPLAQALSLPESAIYAAFSGSLALAGLFAPWAGRLVDRHGGRAVLVASTVCGAAGLLLLAISHGWHELLGGYALLGVAMALGLYETCFAAMAQLGGLDYRSTVGGVTLIAGLASSVFWPLSHHSAAVVGVRATFAMYAGLLLAVCLPIYLGLLPRLAYTRTSTARTAAVSFGAAEQRLGCSCARSLAWAFAGATAVGAGLSAHLLAAFAAVHVESGLAVWLAASIGVLQVLGRALELSGRLALSGRRLGTLSLAALAASLACLLASAIVPSAVLLFALLYGVSNGVLTIVKALVPLELFGARHPGVVLSGFGAPSLLARAGAPLAFVQLSAVWGTQAAVAATCTLALASLGLYVFGLRSFAPACAQGCAPARGSMQTA